MLLLLPPSDEPPELASFDGAVWPVPVSGAVPETISGDVPLSTGLVLPSIVVWADVSPSIVFPPVLEEEAALLVVLSVAFTLVELSVGDDCGSVWPEDVSVVFAETPL